MWTSVELVVACVRGGYFEVGKVERKEGKGLMCQTAKVKWRNLRRMSCDEYLAAVVSMEISM